MKSFVILFDLQKSPVASITGTLLLWTKTTVFRILMEILI